MRIRPGRVGMNTLIRGHFRFDGGPKRRFDSQRDAHAFAASENGHTTGPRLHAYECDFCDGWHVGHGKRRSA